MSSYAESIKVGIEGKYKPYYLDETHGLELDIVNEVFKKIGIKPRYYKFPFERLKSALSKHGMDASLIAYNENNDDYHYSDDYIYFANTVVCNSSKVSQVRSIKDLIGKRLGSWRGAHFVLGKEFNKYFKPGENNYFEVNVLDSLLKMFWLKRLHCIVVDSFVFKWFKQYELKNINIKQFPISYHYLVDRRTYFKVKFKSKEIRDKFNIAHRELRENGFIKKIYKKYIPEVTADDLKWSLEKTK